VKLTVTIKNPRLWKKAQTLHERFADVLRAHLMPALEKSKREYLQAVRAAAWSYTGKIANKPLTTLFKTGATPFHATGYTIRESHFAAEWEQTKDGVSVVIGVPKNIKPPRTSVSTRMPSLAALLTSLHGGKDLQSPRMMRQPVTPAMTRLFWTVRTRQEYRLGRKHRKKGAAPVARLYGRARQLDQQAGGRLVPVLTTGTILKRRARPFVRDASRMVKVGISHNVRAAVADALAELMGGR
jgi:hypothetical protein